MIWIAMAVGLVGVALFFLARRFEKGRPARVDMPYQKAAALFSPAERSFLGVLQQAVGNHTAVFGKVRAADAVKLQKGLGRSAQQTAYKRIADKYFDFLLCDKEDLSIACAVQFNSGRHLSKHRHTEDEFLKKVCEAVGIPLIWVAAESAYVVSEVQRLLPRYLTSAKAAHPDPSLCPPPPPAATFEKICPNCSAAMVKRVAKKGIHAGKLFWACSAFPECRTVEEISPSS